MIGQNKDLVLSELNFFHKKMNTYGPEAWTIYTESIKRLCEMLKAFSTDTAREACDLLNKGFTLSRELQDPEQERCSFDYCLLIDKLSLVDSDYRRIFEFIEQDIEFS